MTPATFARTWNRSTTVKAVAKALGLTYDACRARAYQMRNRGARLKRMAKGRKPGKGRA